MEHEQQHRVPVRRAVAFTSACATPVAPPVFAHRAPVVLADPSRSLHHHRGDAAHPRRPGSLWEHVWSFEALHAAYRRARRQKRYHAEVLHFSANLEGELLQLQNELIWKTYRPSPYRLFYVHNPKTRQIMAPAFRDRVVHHALCAVLEPLADRRFIFDSYACRIGKGTHAALRRLQAFLRRATAHGHHAWVLKADVSRYFPSVPHQPLLARWRRIIADADVLWLVWEILRSVGAPNTMGEMCGLPIGALTSQVSANVYLDPIDHAVKEVLREPWYLRYMDDMVIVGREKVALRACQRHLAELLASAGLLLNPKTAILSTAVGVPFVGYRIWATHARVLQPTLRRMRRRLRALREDAADGTCDLADVSRRVQSWVAHAAHAESWRVRTALLNDVVFHRPSEA